MTDKLTIYKTYETAFQGVSAYILVMSDCGDIEKLATITFKRGSTGTVRCFLHQIGYTMQQGSAGGGGYDKLSAALFDASAKNLKQFGDRPHSDEYELALTIHGAAEAGNGSSNWYTEFKKTKLTLIAAIG